MKNFSTPYHIFLWVMLALFVGLCVWAHLTAPLPGFQRIFDQPWWLVTFADLALGALCMASLMVFFEPNKLVALIWVASLLVLGNIVSVFWLCFRFTRFINNRSI